MQATATQTLTDVLNKQIANCGVLYIKLHNYHWFVKGENFYELHAKFEEFYDEITGYLDELAERLLAINGKPLATMRDFLQRATITEATGNETPQQMVQNIANDFGTIISELKQGIQNSENENDQATADILIGMRSSLEKHRWMLTSFLAK
ncbi:DNA starvation/stationary phase protection protein [Brevibacillus humidisoli]|uniref:Dps family protein n=1 Tax=Brevibacillus humidisoli TaxID=2895522 RepID=UPI001E43A463|nr:Dps family protein [Brevibacillus humidisoli]UFJ41160.1 DNA starvation/stationary phase protection protein [Brevibacillus humidisoli]